MWAKSVIPFSQFLWFWDYSLLFFSLVFISQVLRLTLYEVILGIAIRKEGRCHHWCACYTYILCTDKEYLNYNTRHQTKSNRQRHTIVLFFERNLALVLQISHMFADFSSCLVSWRRHQNLTRWISDQVEKLHYCVYNVVMD